MKKFIDAETRFAWSSLEAGKTESLKFEQLEKLFREGMIDPRYIFGLTDSVELADLKEHPIAKNLYEEVAEIKTLIKNRSDSALPPKGINSVHDFFREFPQAIQIIERLMKIPFNEVEKIIENVNNQIIGIEVKGPETGPRTGTSG